MRVTITLDDDLAALLEHRAWEIGIAFDEVVNLTVRSGLEGGAEVRRGSTPKTVPHSFGFRARIDTHKLGQLADELEAECFEENPCK